MLFLSNMPPVMPSYLRGALHLGIRNMQYQNGLSELE